MMQGLNQNAEQVCLKGRRNTFFFKQWKINNTTTRTGFLPLLVYAVWVLSGCGDLGALQVPGQREKITLTGAVGDKNACATKIGVGVKCWGSNTERLLNNNPTIHIGNDASEMGSALQLLNTGGLPSQVVVGPENLCVLRNTSIYCWGANAYGQLGTGNTTTRPYTTANIGTNLPTIDVGGAVVQMAVRRHICVLLKTQTIKCWGKNTNGQLGLGLGTNANRGINASEMGTNLPAINLGAQVKVAQIANNLHNTCVVTTLGAVKCWGLNLDGQLGQQDVTERGVNAAEMGDSLLAINLGSQGKTERIGVGAFHVCALFVSKQIKCWGKNQHGQLGLGDTNNRGDAVGEMGDALPAVFLGASLIPTMIASGANHNCVLFTNYSVKCWGSNQYGQLGLGNTNHRGDAAAEMGEHLPVLDIGGRAVAIYAAGDTSCALLENNTLKCWGSNTNGILGQGDSNHRGDAAAELGTNLSAISLEF